MTSPRMALTSASLLALLVMKFRISGLAVEGDMVVAQELWVEIRDSEVPLAQQASEALMGGMEG